MPGTLIGIYAGARAGADKAEVESAELLEGFGVSGDSHAGRDPDRQVSLFDDEVLRQILAEGFAVTPAAIRANLFTSGIELAALAPGARLRVGVALVEVVAPRLPCRSLTEIDRRLPKRLFGRCGQLGRVLAGGTVRAGDPVEVI